MNIFTAIGQVIKAANTNYREQQREKELYAMKREAIIQERRSKALLKSQLEELLIIVNDKGYKALVIEIARECEPFVEEAQMGLECEITSMGNGKYLLEPKEVILE